ncbi:hypothetical protein ACFQGX_41165 [Nonomuraea dietziae]|uniref:hypothetical protein n=1 Tax=Nonomuraea dietziae TaxID=65515 RepID=UPI0036168A9D
MGDPAFAVQNAERFAQVGRLGESCEVLGFSFDAVVVPGRDADEVAGAEVQQGEVGGDLFPVVSQDVVTGLISLVVAELVDPLQGTEFLGSPPLAVDGDVSVVGHPVAAGQLLQRSWCFERDQPAHGWQPAEIGQRGPGRRQWRKRGRLLPAGPLRARLAAGEPLLATCCLLRAAMLRVGLAHGVSPLADDHRNLRGGIWCRRGCRAVRCSSTVRPNRSQASIALAGSAVMSWPVPGRHGCMGVVLRDEPLSRFWPK